MSGTWPDEDMSGKLGQKEEIVYQFILRKYVNGKTEDLEAVQSTLYNNERISQITCEDNKELEDLAFAAMEAIRRRIKMLNNQRPDPKPSKESHKGG